MADSTKNYLDEEEEYYDNMPENLQGSMRGTDAEEAIDTIEEVNKKYNEEMSKVNSVFIEFKEKQLQANAINEKTRLYSILDVQFHQDGKINPLSALYEEDRPWETEYTLAFGLGMREKEELPEFVIEVSLHSGRVPLLNYWFKKTKYVSLGVGLSF